MAAWLALTQFGEGSSPSSPTLFKTKLSTGLLVAKISLS